MSGLISFNNSTPKTSIRRKDLVDLLYTHAELSYFVSNFVAMATSVSRGRMILSSFNSQTSAMCRDRGDISSTSWVMIYFVSNFVAMATRVRRAGIVRPRKPPDRRKNLGDISYKSWVIVIEVATWVGCGGICLTSFNSPTPKTPGCVQESRGYLPQIISSWVSHPRTTGCHWSTVSHNFTCSPT